MDGNEILLNSDELNDLAEELKKLAVDDIYQDIEVDWKIVQLQAKTFITNYERLEKIQGLRSQNFGSKMFQNDGEKIVRNQLIKKTK